MKITNYSITSTQFNENGNIVAQVTDTKNMSEIEFNKLFDGLVNWLHKDPFRSAIICYDGLEMRLSSYKNLVEEK